MTSTARTRAYYLAYFALLAAATLLIAEVGLRVFFRDAFAVVHEPAESLFWIKDDNLGWAHSPNASGEFSNGFFRGNVHIDEYGNRKNSAAGTFVPEYPTVVFIGDSTVASFEVNDDETIPAQLETRLRAQHQLYNVVNLGVRGYGTDQAVRKALAFAELLHPSDVIYMFVDNDMYDNNVLRQSGRRFGKGVYMRTAEDKEFEPRNYPVPDYPSDFAGLVVLDDHCTPILHAVTLSAAEQQVHWGEADDASWYVQRAGKRIYKALRGENDAAIARIDPYKMISRSGVRWSFDFFHAYKVYGAVRHRCGSYLEAQVAFLLRQLRTIPSVQRVHVVHFPGEVVLHALRENGASSDSEFFSRLVANGSIDTYLDLPHTIIATGVDTAPFSCPHDPHFCRDGNAWIVAQILQGAHFPDTRTARFQ